MMRQNFAKSSVFLSPFIMVVTQHYAEFSSLFEKIDNFKYALFLRDGMNQ